jgi:gamma-tubulin complex component 4
LIKLGLICNCAKTIWHNADLLPVYISIRVANKILFVGESIQMFETDRKPATHKKGEQIL